jgi:hypothetical protein
MSKQRTTSMNVLTPTQCAYIAGIIDGEGTITVSRKSDHKGMKRGYCFRPYVSVSNTNKLLLVWLQQTTGLGRLYKYASCKPRCKQAWQWQLWSNQAGQLLTAVLPHLLVKSGQAELLLGFIKVKRDGVGRAGLSAIEWSRQEETYEQIKQLNRRGVN